jgi:hypothetical protein
MLEKITACSIFRGCRRVTGAFDAVVFDVGEGLVDETRGYGTWADWAGCPPSRVLGILRDLGLPADMIATSDDWHVSKPDPGSSGG